MVFLTLIVVGIVGLAVMALPAFAHGAHGGSAGAGHAFSAGHHVAAPGGHGSVAGAGAAQPAASLPALQFLLSPRALFSLVAMYGATGNVLVRVAHMTPALAGFVAVVPALAIERLVVSPLWNLMFRYQGQPSSPLYELILREAKAVTPFKNGRGIVAVERDGRLVQFVARLSGGHGAVRVRVGERLRIEEVDGGRECLVVSLPASPEQGDGADKGASPKRPG
jgi:hypothetical protein